MTSLFETILQIVRNTPLWVWPLMVLVIWLGILGLRSRTLPLWRLAVLPAVGLVLSFVGIGQAVEPALALVAWLAALAAALLLGDLLGRRPTVRRLQDGRLEIAGGWFMLVFGISIFAARYVLGVVFGMAPSLRVEPVWIALGGGIGGFVAGIGLGWLGGVGGRSNRWVARLGRAPAIFLLVMVVGFGGVIAFSGPGELPRLPAGDSLPGMSTWNMAELPPVQRVTARDGAPLAYRVYPARPDRAVVLIHGSSGTNISMHKSAQALQAAGATVYSISLRGHGGSGTANGDTSYRTWPHEARNSEDADRFLVRRRLRAAHGERRQPRGLRCLSRDLALHRAGCAHDAPCLRWLGECGRAACDRTLDPRWLRHAVVPGTAGRALRHGLGAERQPYAGLFLPAGRGPSAQPRLAERNRAHRSADDRRRRRKR